MKSKCCNSTVRVEGDTTKYYVCDNCNKGCDIDDTIKRLEELKRNTRVATGSFKYDWCYDECIDIVKHS